MNEIVKHESNQMMTIDESVSRYNALVEFTRTVMKRDKDFGIIPGTDKPTLLKPGAEKLAALFGFAPEFEIIDSEKNWKDGMFYFQYRCMLKRNGEIIATGIGSCNSMEKKYRYRFVPSFKATQEEKDSAISQEVRKNKNGGEYVMYKIQNPDVYDLVNTIDKMAQKRAFIAATLIGANASEFFTQDVEDMAYIEGDYEVIEPKQAKTQAPESAKIVPTKNPEPEPDPAYMEERANLKERWHKVAEHAIATGVQLPRLTEAMKNDEIKVIVEKYEAELQ